MKAQELLDFRKEVVRMAFCKIYQFAKKNDNLDRIKTDLVINSVHNYLALLSLGNINEKIGERLGIYVSDFFNKLNPSIHSPDYLYLNRALSADYEFSQVCHKFSKIDPKDFPADVAFKDSAKNEALNFFKTSAENFVDKTLKLNLVNSGDAINSHILSQNIMICKAVTKAFLSNDMELKYIKDLDIRDIRNFLGANSDFDIIEYGSRKAFKRIFEKTKDDNLELEF